MSARENKQPLQKKTIRQGKTSHRETGQGNPNRGEESQEQTKKSETHRDTSTIRSPTKTVS